MFFKILRPRILAFFKKFLQFSSLEIVCNFRFLQPQEPRNLLYSLIIGFGMVSRCNGMFFKILTEGILVFFLQNLNFFQFLDIVIIQRFSISGV